MGLFPYLNKTEQYKTQNEWSVVHFQILIRYQN